jgi:hypothetical protein
MFSIGGSILCVEAGKMILIRDIMYCKPGKVRPLVEKFIAMNEVSQRLGFGSARVMTDLFAERYWTVVTEWEARSLQEYEELNRKSMDNPELMEMMKGYHDLVDHGRREIYTIETTS